MGPDGFVQSRLFGSLDFFFDEGGSMALPLFNVNTGSKVVFFCPHDANPCHSIFVLKTEDNMGVLLFVGEGVSFSIILLWCVVVGGVVIWKGLQVGLQVELYFSPPLVH